MQTSNSNSNPNPLLSCFHWGKGRACMGMRLGCGWKILSILHWKHYWLFYPSVHCWVQTTYMEGPGMRLTTIQHFGIFTLLHMTFNWSLESSYYNVPKYVTSAWNLHDTLLLMQLTSAEVSKSSFSSYSRSLIMHKKNLCRLIRRPHLGFHHLHGESLWMRLTSPCNHWSSC